MSDEEPRYTLRDIGHLTGITYRQLDYWCSRGWFGDDLRNIGHGYRREFTEQHVALLRTAGRLVRVGFRPDTAAVVARQLVERGSYQIRDGTVVVMVSAAGAVAA